MNDGIERIRSFADLENDWDGYGAITVSNEAIVKAIRVHDAIKGYAFTFPTVDGGISFEFSGKEHELSIEIGPDGTIAAVDFHEKARICESWEELIPNPN